MVASHKGKEPGSPGDLFQYSSDNTQLPTQSTDRKLPALYLSASNHRKLKTRAGKGQTLPKIIMVAASPPIAKGTSTTEASRHRCGAWSSKPMYGSDVVGRFDSCTLPPIDYKGLSCRPFLVLLMQHPVLATETWTIFGRSESKSSKKSETP